jgi:hypothetical protein
VSEAEGRIILDSLEAIKPGILTGLSTLVAKRLIFDAFPFLEASTTALETLKQLATAFATFGTPLLALAPVRLFLLIFN